MHKGHGENFVSSVKNFVSFVVKKICTYLVVCQINFFTSDPKDCKVQAEISLRTLRKPLRPLRKKNVKELF